VYTNSEKLSYGPFPTMQRIKKNEIIEEKKIITRNKYTISNNNSAWSHRLDVT
jgi:hypothetical protein